LRSHFEEKSATELYTKLTNLSQGKGEPQDYLLKLLNLKKKMQAAKRSIGKRVGVAPREPSVTSKNSSQTVSQSTISDTQHILLQFDLDVHLGEVFSLSPKTKVLIIIGRIFHPFALNLLGRNIHPTNNYKIGWIIHPLPWMENPSKTKINSSDGLPSWNRLVNDTPFVDKNKIVINSFFLRNKNYKIKSSHPPHIFR
jgi:hypothetical protein